VLDYLQMVRPSDDQPNREQEVARVSEALTSIAKGLNVAVLALAQLNREAEKGPPALHHLRESGSIEADAALVAVIHRDSANEELMELEVLKNRNGPLAQARLRFDPPTQRVRGW
jgi:replicative DNA helicase